MTGLWILGVRKISWLNAVGLVVSAVIWLAVSSSWAVVLHAVGKLGLSASGYGTANLVLLVSALIWSFAGSMFFGMAWGIPSIPKAILYFGVNMLVLVYAVGFVAVISDFWLSQHVVLGLLLQIFELCAAIWISWIIFFKFNDNSRAFTLLGSSQFAFFGLTAATAFALLTFPRVTFRI